MALRLLEAQTFFTSCSLHRSLPILCREFSLLQPPVALYRCCNQPAKKASFAFGRKVQKMLQNIRCVMMIHSHVWVMINNGLMMGNDSLEKFADSVAKKEEKREERKTRTGGEKWSFRVLCKKLSGIFPSNITSSCVLQYFLALDQKSPITRR